MTKATKKPIITQGQVLTVEYGRNLIIPVYGEVYAQDSKQTALKRLYKQYGKKHLQFSLTPPSNYQIERKWPEQPFLNVNVRGSIQTTKENWLGYIHPFEPEEKDEKRLERKKYIKRLIWLGGYCPLIISGKIIKEGSQYSMLLFASRKYIDQKVTEVKKSRTIWEEQRKIKRKRWIIIGSVVSVIIVILCVVFWQQIVTFFQYLIGFIILLCIIGIFSSSKKH